jgi:hypothetical protein
LAKNFPLKFCRALAIVKTISLEWKVFSPQKFKKLGCDVAKLK